MCYIISESFILQQQQMARDREGEGGPGERGAHRVESTLSLSVGLPFTDGGEDPTCLSFNLCI